MPIYLQIDGIQGDATHEQHKKWMDIEVIQNRFIKWVQEYEQWGFLL